MFCFIILESRECCLIDVCARDVLRNRKPVRVLDRRSLELVDDFQQVFLGDVLWIAFCFSLCPGQTGDDRRRYWSFTSGSGRGERRLFYCGGRSWPERTT